MEPPVKRPAFQRALESLRRWARALRVRRERARHRIASWYAQFWQPAVARTTSVAVRYWRALTARVSPALAATGRWLARYPWSAVSRSVEALGRWSLALLIGLRRAAAAVRQAFAARSQRRREARRRLMARTIVADRDDDLATVMGRIDFADDSELVLIVPRSARALRDPGAWPRLAAHVRHRGISLGVVAARRDVRNHAQDSGLEAAGSLRALRRPRFRRVRVGAREFDLPRLRPFRALRWLALPALAGALFVTACYVVPSAEIVIVPPAEPFTRSTLVRIDPVADEADLELRVTPGITVRRTVTTVMATESTGTTEIGDAHASVQLLITNNGAAAAGLRAGTRVVNESGIVFTTDEAVTVPAGDSIVVVATAERAGTIANLDAEETWSLSGGPRTLRVTNPRAADGGTDLAVPAIAAEDADRLRSMALDVLSRAGGRELARTVEAGAAFPETVTVAILGEESFARIGEPAATLVMEFTAIVSGLVLLDEQARAFGEALLVAALDDGVALLPGTTTVELAPERTFAGGALSLRLVATGLVARLFDPADMRDELTGARPADAARVVQRRLGLAIAPQVTVYPDWLPWLWLPRRGSRISITLAGPPASEDIESAGSRAP